MIVYHRSHLFRGTRKNYWLYHGKLPCLFHHLGEYVLLVLEESPLSYQQNEFIFCLPWWDLWLFFFRVPARPKARTCWVRRSYLCFFLPFTHHLVGSKKTNIIKVPTKFSLGGGFCQIFTATTASNHAGRSTRSLEEVSASSRGDRFFCEAKQVQMSWGRVDGLKYDEFYDV